MSKKVCILGSANADFFIYVHKIPQPGETIQAVNTLFANGGKGANQAVAVARLAGHSVFLGQVGDDDDKQRLQKQMKQSGVQLGWKIKHTSNTGKAIIFVDKQGENSIVIIGGANIDYQNLTELSQQYRKGIQSCDYLMLQKEIPMAINVLAAEYARSLNKIVMLDCGGSDEEIKQNLLKNLNYISPNSTELLRIDPSIDSSNVVTEIRNKLIAKYPNLKFVLKQGSKGARVITKQLDISVDAVTHLNKSILDHYKIIDTVGAGDCFTSAFIVKHSELDWKEPQKDYGQCLLFGNSAAFLCITKKGAMPSLPYKQDVEQFTNRFFG